jgi:hypothetical protein
MKNIANLAIKIPLFLLLLGILLSGSTDAAYGPGLGTHVTPLFINKTLAPNATLTSTNVNVGFSTIQGLDWDITSAGAISLNMQVLQTNITTGTYTLWSNPNATGATVSNNITATTAVDGTALAIDPSEKMKIKITNTSNTTATVNRLSSFTQ